MFTFQNTISIGDILNIVFLGLTVVGIFLTIHQLKRGQEAQRANFLKELYLTMLGDPGIRTAFYLIDQEKIQHDVGHFKDPAQEPQIDQLLNFADLVCELHERKMLTTREISFFKYQFIRIYENKEIQNYLNFLKDVFEKKAASVPFASFVSYCEKELSLSSQKPSSL